MILCFLEASIGMLEASIGMSLLPHVKDEFRIRRAILLGAIQNRPLVLIDDLHPGARGNLRIKPELVVRNQKNMIVGTRNLLQLLRTAEIP